MTATSGFSTVELLLALVLFALGALGAASTLALGLRATSTGGHMASAARLGADALGQVTAAAAHGAGSCAALPAPSLSSPGGESAVTTLRPAGRGVRVEVALRFQGGGGPRQDTLGSFVRCR